MKHVLKSKTVWGGLITIITAVVLFATAKSSSDKYFALNLLFSGVLTIYGRLKAEHKLYFRRKNNAKTINKHNISSSKYSKKN